MKLFLAQRSLLLLGISVLLLLLLTRFESALPVMSPGAERAFTFLVLVVPAAVGSFLGVMSLVLKEGRTWMAGTGAVLNALFALFHVALLLFAG
jgi:hypothetical protein